MCQNDNLLINISLNSPKHFVTGNGLDKNCDLGVENGLRSLI